MRKSANNSFYLFCASYYRHNLQANVEKRENKTRRIKFQQAPDGTLVKQKTIKY